MRTLLIEDDAFYAQAITELLIDRDVLVTCVHTAEDALAADIESHGAAIIDVMLPNNPEASGITNEESRGGFCAGVCVARRLLRKRPGMKVVLLTSDVVDTEAETWAHQHNVVFIRKDEGSSALLRSLDRLGITGSDRSPVCLIVHGHDESALRSSKTSFRML